MNDDKRRGMLKATVFAGMALATYAGGCGVPISDGIRACATDPCAQPQPQPQPQPAPRKLEKPVVCTIDPKLLDDPSASKSAKLSVSPDGRHLYVTRGDRTHRLNVEDACNLTLDTTFAEGGVLESPMQQVFETERGTIFDSGGVLSNGTGSPCRLGNSLFAIADEGDIGAAVAVAGTDSKVLQRFVPSVCSIDASTENDPTLRAALHVAAGPGPGGALLFAALPPNQATTIESYDPRSHKVTKVFTLNTPASAAPFLLTGIRGCDEDLCAFGTKDQLPAFYRFSPSGDLLRQMALSDEPDLPSPVRKAFAGVEPGTVVRAALTRTGFAYVALQNAEGLRIIRLSLNLEANSGDAGTDAPSGDATSDASTVDAMKDDASDAGSD